MTYFATKIASGLAAGLITLAAGAAAAAPTVAAGPLYASTTQTHAVCYLFNSGAASVTISSVKIFDPFGNALKFSHDECNGATLTPGASCGSVATTNGNTEYGCTATVSNKAAIRGDFQMRDVNEYALAHEALR